MQAKQKIPKPTNLLPPMPAPAVAVGAMAAGLAVAVVMVVCLFIKIHFC